MAATAQDPAPRPRVYDVVARTRRLFGPQMSSAARERRDILVLLLAVTFVALPHFEHLPWWTIALLLLMLFWRGFLIVAQLPLPGRFLMVPLLLGAGAGIYLQYGTLVGQQAGVTFLLLLMALKLLEMRARRDVFVVIFLCFFILLTQFMYSQGVGVAAMTLMAVAALFFVLVSVNLDEADLPAARKIKMVGWAMVKAVPLTIVLFLLFPRLSGPLWGTPGDGPTGSTGLSNSMTPGSIGKLIESREIAFRVKFEGNPPGSDQLYWRGPVFGAFNGRTWSPLVRRHGDPSPVAIEADRNSLIEYTVTLEPHQRDWLFALEAPAGMPQLAGLNPRLTSEMELLASDLVRERIRYTMRSYLSFRSGRNADPLELADWLSLPEGFNLRARELAGQLQQRETAPGDGRDLRLVRATLDHFRNGGYAYTLNPPRLGKNSVDEFLLDTKAGFCEHYSSAFVVLMRSLGVPARVVTGYQGGELNPIDGFVTIRQADAHAWAEVWLTGRGWVRVDPTSVVAPIRIDPATEEARKADERTPAFASSNWLRVWRFNWEAVQNSWNQYVLSYSLDRQRALVGMLGLAPRWESVAGILAVIVGVLLAGMALVSMRPRTVSDPLGDTFRLLREKLERAGVHTEEHCGPRALYRRARMTLAKSDAQRARKLLSRYERMRYSRSSEGVIAADVRALRRAVRAFKPAPNPE